MGCGGAKLWVSFIILLCLAGIAAGVYLKQFSFNPAVLGCQLCHTRSDEIGGCRLKVKLHCHCRRVSL